MGGGGDGEVHGGYVYTLYLSDTVRLFFVNSQPHLSSHGPQERGWEWTEVWEDADACGHSVH